MPAVDTSAIIYAYFFVITTLIYGLYKIFHKAVINLISESVEELFQRLTRIEYQLYNNGGESMKDSVDRIEQDVVKLRINQAAIQSKLEK
jgi:hypothetical protein